MTQEVKNFCTIEYLDSDGTEIVTHAVLSHDEQMKTMEEFIQRGIIATIYDHSTDVNSFQEDNGESKLCGQKMEINTESSVERH